eukprot:5379400-Prymnesium_polylepis.2
MANGAAVAPQLIATGAAVGPQLMATGAAAAFFQSSLRSGSLTAPLKLRGSGANRTRSGLAYEGGVCHMRERCGI